MEEKFLNKMLKTLELDAVLEMLAERAVSGPAKQAALDLRPDDNLWEIKEGLAEAGTAKNMIVIKGSPALHGISDIRASAERAGRGGTLNTGELLKTAGVMRAARTVRAYGQAERDEETRLDYLFHALKGNKYLEERITGSIIGEGELADSASTDLADIRRKIRAASSRVRDILQRIITSPAYSKALQDPIITMRSDRYVVPVKAESKNAVPGLIHDISSSGATVFVEPMSVVEANNEIRELMAKEEAEVERILTELSAEVADCRDDLESDLEILIALDLIFAKAKLSFDMNGSEPDVTESGGIVLRRARHPLLQKETVVPIDIALGEDYDTLVITGPNTGGKTVCIKTLGLLCLMVRCGLHIPVDDGSSVPVFNRILADIGDEQSIEQSLSTFSSHMTNIVNILQNCNDSTLLLFDELGAGTDPVEGAALAMAIIEFARGVGAKIAATTHYSELKAYATTRPGVMNASCEFDVDTLRPTYRLLTGIPGKSNAFAISRRLGLSEDIIEDAQSRIGEENAGFEEMISKLEHQRREMEYDRIRTAKNLKTAEEESRIAEKLRRELEKTRQDALEAARREAKGIIEDARRVSDEVVEEIRRVKRESSKSGDWQEINQSRADIRGKLNRAEENLADIITDPQNTENTRPIRAGDTVELLSLGTKAQVISIEADGTLNLQAGIMKVAAAQNTVKLLEDEKQLDKAAVSARSGAQLKSMGTSPELDLRGMTAEEAIPVMERYVDSAMMSGLGSVTIIHGKGTGVLRKAVHLALKKIKGIESFRLGRFGEGEDGVTIVQLK